MNHLTVRRRKDQTAKCRSKWRSNRNAFWAMSVSTPKRSAFEDVGTASKKCRAEVGSNLLELAIEVFPDELRWSLIFVVYAGVQISKVSCADVSQLVKKARRNGVFDEEPIHFSSSFPIEDRPARAKRREYYNRATFYFDRMDMPSTRFQKRLKIFEKLFYRSLIIGAVLTRHKSSHSGCAGRFYPTEGERGSPFFASAARQTRAFCAIEKQRHDVKLVRSPNSAA